MPSPSLGAANLSLLGMSCNPPESGHVAEPLLSYAKSTRLAVELAAFESVSAGTTNAHRLGCALRYRGDGYWSCLTAQALRQPCGRKTCSFLFLYSQ